MNDNEYLQKKVMEMPQAYDIGCGCAPDGLPMPDCTDCNGTGETWEPNEMDFSTPTDYCALEDKIDEENWLRFFIWMSENEGSTGNYRASVWQRTPRTQRAALIAEYWRQR